MALGVTIAGLPLLGFGCDDEEADITGTGTGTATGGGGEGGMAGAAGEGGEAASGGGGGAAGAAGQGGDGGGGGGVGGSTAIGDSCESLPEDCGPDADESCCANLLVSGGDYYRSYDGIDYDDDGYPATVADFYLDRFEVTVGRFRNFVDAGKGTRADPPDEGQGAHPLIDDSGWNSGWDTFLAVNTAGLEINLAGPNQTWTNDPDANENMPINWASWYEAFAFCAWDGGRLPTEAEWNYAAAGGNQQRYYPWSDPYPPGSTDIDDTYAAYNNCCGIPLVGSRSPNGDGRWGQADLAGSMLEWALDRYVDPYATPCDNCAALTGGNPVRRGGSWANPTDTQRTAERTTAVQSRFSTTGFRCARDDP